MSQHRETGETSPNTTPEHQPVDSPEVTPGTGSPGIWPPVTQVAPTQPASPPSVTPRSGEGAGRAPARPSRKHLVFGAAGLGLGLIVGLGLGQINIPFASSAINDAAETCNVTETAGIEIGDNGQSISMSSEGEESAGADYSDIDCVLAELKVPDSVDTRIGTTRALDGRQSADWDEFAASWGYHPDSGLNIVIEITNK